MSCWLCEHSNYSYELLIQQGDPDHAKLQLKCRLNPVWVDVSGEHVCGQFRDNHWGSGYSAKYMRESVSNSTSEFNRWQERARDAERKLKAANAKIRDLRGKKDG